MFGTSTNTSEAAGKNGIELISVRLQQPLLQSGIVVTRQTSFPQMICNHISFDARVFEDLCVQNNPAGIVAVEKKTFRKWSLLFIGEAISKLKGCLVSVLFHFIILMNSY